MSLFGHRVLNGREKRSWWENEVGKAEIYIYTRIGNSGCEPIRPHIMTVYAP